MNNEINVAEQRLENLTFRAFDISPADDRSRDTCASVKIRTNRRKESYTSYATIRATVLGRKDACRHVCHADLSDARDFRRRREERERVRSDARVADGEEG